MYLRKDAENSNFQIFTGKLGDLGKSITRNRIGKIIPKETEKSELFRIFSCN